MSREWLTVAWLRMKTLVQRRWLDRDLEEELQFHLAMREKKNRALGLGVEEAQAAARRRFGNVTSVKEQCREQWTFNFIETLWRDLHYAARGFTKSPGFTAVVVFSLALGIGASTTIFSVINTVLLRALPYEHSERLTVIWATKQGAPDSQDAPPIAELVDWKKQNHVFDDIAAISFSGTGTLSGVGEPEQIRVQDATPNFFALLGVQPAFGRVFRADENQDQFQTVVITHSFWKNKFNNDPNVLGKTFRIDGVVSTVVGVMPAGFSGFAPYYEGKLDVWVPIHPESERNAQRRDHGMMPVGRLKPGVTLPQAQLEMDVIARRLEQAYPETNKGVGKKLVPLYDALYEDAGGILYRLLGAVCLVLLIGCVNVANLIQSRTEVRRKEYSLRAALGADRRRLMQQSLAESGVLALIGGLVGVLLSFWGTHLLRVLVDYLPDAESISVDSRVLLFALGLSALTTVLFGLAPAVRASRPNLNAALRVGESRALTGSRRPTRQLLVIAEVALAMVLLVGAGLMINSLLRLVQANPGFDSTNVLSMAINFPEGGKYLDKAPGVDVEKTMPRVTTFHQQLLERVATLPGVESVGMISLIPPLGAGSRSFSILGRPAPATEERPEAGYNEVSSGFFTTMRIPLKRGRYFDDSDTQGAPWALVINETLARLYFPNEDPVGKYVLLRYQPELVDEDRPRQIIGIVGDVKQVGLGGLHPLLYESYLQQPAVFPGDSAIFHLWGGLVIRTASDVHAHEADLAASVKKAVRELDSDQPVTNIQTLDQVLWKSIGGYRSNILVFAVFAGMAALLAAIGLYGIMSYFVNQRSHEMGIRLALGAQGGDVLRMVAKLGLKLVGTGITIGAMLALVLTRLLLEGRLYAGVKPTDPLTYAVIVTLLVCTALLAGYVPARRATRVDPVVALRHE